MTTALQFLAQFRHAEVRALGRRDDLYWALTEVDEDGTEPQGFFVMERGDVLRVIQNLTAVEEVHATRDPLPFWDHPRVTVADTDEVESVSDL